MYSKPDTINHCLVDADIVAYRAAAGTEGKSPRETEEKVDLLMNYIVSQTIVFPSSDNLECYLTGKSNFRYEVAKTAPYKGNRANVPKPSNLPEARAWLQHKWGSVISDGEEADDLLSISATKKNSDTTVICTVDKDLLQVPGWNFNFVKNEWTCIGVEDGNKFFYTQILTGDSADHILGLYRICLLYTSPSPRDS